MIFSLDPICRLGEPDGCEKLPRGGTAGFGTEGMNEGVAGEATAMLWCAVIDNGSGVNDCRLSVLLEADSERNGSATDCR